MPALAATGLMVAITWVDTGILRSAQTAATGLAVDGSVSGAPLGDDEFADALRSGGMGPTMILVPEGSMQVPCWPPGCRAPEASAEGVGEEVIFERPFGLSKYEITEAEFARFVESAGYGWTQAVEGDGRLPVVGVSWRDAVAYTEWLSEQTDRAYRLAREVEWEYSARAGAGALGERFDGAPGSDRARGVATVGSAPPNAWGFHDMHDNVSEWVMDCEGAVGEAGDNGAAGCTRHVQRGGSWVHSQPHAGAAARALTDANFRARHLGFRVAALLE